MFLSWMWKWIQSFVQQRRDDFDIYRPKERLIYTYWNGRETVQADPLTLYKKMMQVGPELSIDIKVANSESKDANKAHDGVIRKIRGIFNTLPMESGGLSEIETCELLDHFLVFCETVKKNMNPSATSLMGAQEGLKPSSREENRPTPITSDSGSTEKEPSGEKQESLPTEPALHSE